MLLNPDGYAEISVKHVKECNMRAIWAMQSSLMGLTPLILANR